MDIKKHIPDHERNCNNCTHRTFEIGLFAPMPFNIMHAEKRGPGYCRFKLQHFRKDDDLEKKKCDDWTF